MVRSQKEIVQRIQTLQPNDPFGFGREVLLSWLDYEHARPLLKDDVSAEMWDALPLTDDAVVAEMRVYMPHAWSKALGERGISAQISVVTVTQWLWLLGNDALLAELDRTSYAPYGVPKLRKVCEAYGFNIPLSVQVTKNV